MLFTVKETCKHLSIGRTLAYKLIAQGELVAVKLCGCTRVTRESVEGLIKTRTMNPQTT